jgi:ribosomal protein L40E
MTRDAIVPLESYRLVQYAVPIPCYICETENTYDAESCRNCLAPMALAHQANSQKLRPSMIAVMGGSAVGKTVYLGMLMDMLSRQPERMQLLARGAFSITLQQTTMSALARCSFPEKTVNDPDRWNWVHCQIRWPKRRRPWELIVPDMAGEALFEEIHHPHSYRVISAYLKKCIGAMILVDTLRLKEGSRDQDYFTMKLVSYLAELHDDPKESWQRRPVAMVFTKADQCEACVADPAGYAQAHASGLWQQCQERFSVHKFFATGVAGACVWRESRSEGRVRVPLRIEPFGIVEPFEWLLEQIKAQKLAGK